MMSAWNALPTGEQTLVAVCDTLEDAVQSLRHLQATESPGAPALLLVGVTPATLLPEHIDLPGGQVIAVPTTAVGPARRAVEEPALLQARGLDGPARQLYQAYLAAERVVLLVVTPDQASAHVGSDLLALTNAYDIRMYPLARSQPGHGPARALPGAAALATLATATPAAVGDVSALALGVPSVVGGAATPGQAADSGADVLSAWRSGGELARSATGDEVTAVATRPES
jgi:hypothetical protein